MRRIDMSKHATNLTRPLVSSLSLALFAMGGLFAGIQPANADIWPGLEEQRCMADAYGGKLNCTANDVEITAVNPIDADGDRAFLPGGIPNPDYDAVECTINEIFVLNADLTIRTNANERWDTTFYMPLNEKSPQDLQNDALACSLAVPDPADVLTELDLNGNTQPAYVDLDGDQCADITKALGPDQYTLYDEHITMYCQASQEDPTKALFTYCAAWDNQTGNNCIADVDTVPAPDYYGQVPSQKSKCNCDAFAIDVFIRPPAPTLTKTLVGTHTQPEPGGEYTFDLSFSNPSTTASIFVSGLTDWVDEGADGTYETELDLWGTPVAVVPDTPGIYLVDSTCPVGDPLAEVLPTGTYSCQITVHIVDSDLPDDQSPELYDDVIVAMLEDKNGDPVTDGGTCPFDPVVPGENCSNTQQVQVTNLAPSITVTKTPSVDEVLEPGGNVTFDIVVTSTSGSYDDPLTITSLTDSDFTNLGTCATGGALYVGSPYTCSFTAYIAGDAGDVHSNTLTAKAVDNEYDEAQASDSATVNINDVPSSITLDKTANPIEVLETGDDSSVFRDVAYTFEFCVDAAGVDDVTFSSLSDDQFGDLTALCNVGGTDPATALNGYVLSPGQCASCTITLQVQGNAGDTHVNVATISGTDEDGQPVQDSDPATVTFLNAELDITQQFAIKATAFVRLFNGGVDTATIDGLTIGGVALVADGGVAGQFVILDEAASSSYTGEAGESYAFCATGVDILPQTWYDCAFTLKLLPGFEAGDINLLATGANGLVVTLVDDDGSEVTADVDITIQTQE
jgi:hypothetical protein